MRRCYTRLANGVHCGEPAIWQDPLDRTWRCEEHAPAIQARPRCTACGRAGAWRHPTSDVWFCLAHVPPQLPMRYADSGPGRALVGEAS